jgi:hypothetical protein
VRNAYKVLAGNPERRRKLERPKCGWSDAIKIDFKEIFWSVCTGSVYLKIQSHDQHV